MSLTFIGAIQALIGMALLMFGSIPAMFTFLLFSGMMGGSAAIIMYALGGSSIPPIQFALLFMAIRVLVPGAGQMPRVGEAFRSAIFLFCFAAYAIVMAYLGPRIFQNQIDVTPMRGRTESRYVSQYAYIYATQPLRPSSQNITTSIYLIGTFLITIGSFVACSYERGRDALVKNGVIIAILHVLIGIVDVVTRGSAAGGIIALFRNGSYAQVDHVYGSFVRINGIFPEASSYATYAFVWFVFLFECWFRGIKSKLTGGAALLLAMTLAFSTSTTAYASLGIYSAIFALRCAILPRSVRFDRALIIAATSLVLIIVSSAVMLLNPAFAQSFSDLIKHFTVDKADSLSATQRTFWALQGWHAFTDTYGIGIGPGSFRSSSLITAILGCTGLVGTACFLAYVVYVWKPHRFSTYFPSPDPSVSIGAAASWTAFMIALMACINSPTCDPGPEFAVFGGAALALRLIKKRAAVSVQPRTRTLTTPLPA